MSFDAWKSLGCDIDGVTSGRDAGGLCRPSEGAGPPTEGEDSIDNAFASRVISIFFGLASDFDTQTDAHLAAGASTTLFQIEGLDGAADAVGLHAASYRALATTTPPAWDGKDVRLVAPDWLEGADVTSPRYAYDRSYVVGGVWVASDVELTFTTGAQGNDEAVLGPVWRFPVRHATVTIDLRASPAEGAIAGVLDASEFVDVTYKTAMFGGCCHTGCTLASIATQMAQAADMMNDGTQDPSRTCNGISFGVRFRAKPVVLGGVGAPDPPIAGQCAPYDAGMMDAGDGG